MSLKDVAVLATAGYDGCIRVWNVVETRCTSIIQHPTSQVNCMIISPDKTRLYVGGNPNLVVFDISKSSKSEGTVLEGHRGNITALCPGHRMQVLYTASEDGTVKGWDNLGRIHLEIDVHAPVTCAVLHPDQGEIIVGDANGNVHLYDLQCCEKPACSVSLGEGLSCRALAITPNGREISACANNGVVTRFAVTTAGRFALEQIGKWQAHETYILQARYSHDGQLLATTSADHSVRVWRRTAAEGETDIFVLERALNGHKGWVWDCCFSCDSAYLVTGSSDCAAFLWSLRSGEIDRRYTGHQKGISCIAFNDRRL